MYASSHANRFFLLFFTRITFIFLCSALTRRSLDSLNILRFCMNDWPMLSPSSSSSPGEQSKRGTQPNHNQIHNQTKGNLLSNKACRALQEHVDEQSRAKTITIIVFFHGDICQQLFLCDLFLGNPYLRRIKNTAIDKRDSNPAVRTLKLFSMLADAFAR
jgi:hypothetical protein